MTLWKSRHPGKSRFAISHSFNDNKLDDRDPFLENAIASVVSPPTTDHIGLGSPIFGTAGKRIWCLCADAQRILIVYGGS
jgi:hypothetical protein